MSFALTHLCGFGGIAAAAGGEVLVDRTLGTNIGNMTADGGLAAAFNGTTNSAGSACASNNSSDNYIGKTHSAGKRASRVLIYGSNDAGYILASNPSMTWTLYGKNGAAPANGTDGTSLGSVTFTDTANESASREIASSDTATAYDHWWVRTSSGLGLSAYMAELVMYEMT